MPMHTLEVKAIDIDYVKILPYFFKELASEDIPFDFDILNERILRTLKGMVNKWKKHQKTPFDKVLIKEIDKKIINPVEVLEITTTTTPGKVVWINDDSYKVPLILQVSAYYLKEN